MYFFKFLQKYTGKQSFADNVDFRYIADYPFIYMAMNSHFIQGVYFIQYLSSTSFEFCISVQVILLLG